LIPNGLLEKLAIIASGLKNWISVAAFISVPLLCLAAAVLHSGHASRRQLKAVLLMALAILVAGLFPGVPALLIALRGAYNIRVTVTNPDQSLSNRATVTSPAGGEVKPTIGGWEITLPVQSLPSNSTITIYARDPESFLLGKGSITLGQDRHPQMNITLMPQEGGILTGIVENQEGRAVHNARISVIAREPETATTDENGGFTIDPHVADGQMVQLHVEASGFQPADISQPAGKYGFVVNLQPNK
jgi:hypothetical protein